jgi:hypothetical protein
MNTLGRRNQRWPVKCGKCAGDFYALDCEDMGGMCSGSIVRSIWSIAKFRSNEDQRLGSKTEIIK